MLCPCRTSKFSLVLRHFKDGEYKEAEQAYSLAIQKYSQNPLIYTNRAFARLKLGDYEGVIDDCLHSIGLLPENMKAFYYLGMLVGWPPESSGLTRQQPKPSWRSIIRTKRSAPL